MNQTIRSWWSWRKAAPATDETAPSADPPTASQPALRARTGRRIQADVLATVRSHDAVQGQGSPWSAAADLR